MPQLVLQSKGTTGGDTHIFNEGLNENRGLTTIGDAGNINALVSKYLVRFDLSSLPPGAFVTSASLTLYLIGQDVSIMRGFAAYRGLTQWYEGNISGSGSPTVNGSTWNYRNHIGSVPWSGNVKGGQAGGDYSLEYDIWINVGPTTGITYTWDVSSIVKRWANDGAPNHGFWIMDRFGDTDSRKGFASFDNSTASRRPKLTINYTDVRIRSNVVAGSATTTGRLKGRAGLEGASAGSSTFFAQAFQPGSMLALSEGAAAGDGILRGYGYMRGSAAGVATVEASGNLVAVGNLASGSAQGTSTATGRLVHRAPIQGSAAGAASGTAKITMVGLMRGATAGVAGVTGNLWGNAVRKAIPQICESTPLLYITDGSYLPNGQLDMLDLLSVRGGFLLKEWVPNIAQYKNGGYFSDSVTGNGRRLARRMFENAIEVMTLSLKSDNQDRAIFFIREYLRWQELAADYWTSDWSVRPVYLVARAARETLTRYAIIHVMSMPSLGNPYSQPFFNQRGMPAMESLALRIEREPWTDLPPGEFEVVPISSRRTWTVAGWTS